MGANRLKSAFIKNRRRAHDVRGIIARRQLKPIRQKFYQHLWEQAALDTGAVIIPTSTHAVALNKNNISITVDQSLVGLDDTEVNAKMSDKELVFKIASEQGFNVPKRHAYTMKDIRSAEQFLAQHHGHVVVKPAAGTGGGRGVTTGIHTPDQLCSASKFAAGFNDNLLVEEEISGACFRLLYLDGHLIDVVRRDPPVVIGTGRKTIRQLISDENLRRRSQVPITALSPLIIDADCLHTLQRQGLTLNSQPSLGETVQVKTAVNENAAPQNHGVLKHVHPNVVDRIRQLVTDLGVRFAGVDIMTDDISSATAPSTFFFNEINVDPGIHHHYLIADPEQGVPVATLLLEHIFSAPPSTGATK